MKPDSDPPVVTHVFNDANREEGLKIFDQMQAFWLARSNNLTRQAKALYATSFTGMGLFTIGVLVDSFAVACASSCLFVVAFMRLGVVSRDSDSALGLYNGLTLACDHLSLGRDVRVTFGKDLVITLVAGDAPDETEPITFAAADIPGPSEYGL